MTFHIRVVATPGTTEQLVDLLVTEPGVSNVVVLAGSARRPDGDAIQFDVPHRSANRVLQHLKSLRDNHGSPIAVVSVDAVIGDDPDRTASFDVVQRDVAPVWDVVEAGIRAHAVYAPSFYVLLSIAGLIGAVGILTNSQILIVGAMVVGPEYNAIVSVALGIERHERPPVIRGLLALLVGFTVAIALCLAFGLWIRGSGHTPAPYAHGVRPVSELINNPDLFSVVVAALAAIVGVVSLTEARASALIGVFISVTTIPAAADIGLSMAYTSWHAVLGSLQQLLLNVVLLTVVGAAVMRLQRVIWRSRAAG